MNLSFLKYLLIAIWLLYFISPIDVLPDMMGLIGRLDDLALGGYLLYRYAKAAKRISAMHERDAAGEKAKVPEQMQESTDPFEVLGLSKTANNEEIREAYRKKMAEYHPDKVTHLGSDLKELAHQKTLAIQAAYEELKMQRGES